MSELLLTEQSRVTVRALLSVRHADQLFLCLMFMSLSPEQRPLSAEPTWLRPTVAPTAFAEESYQMSAQMRGESEARHQQVQKSVQQLKLKTICLFYLIDLAC